MEKVNPLYENRLLVLLEDIDEGVFRQVFLDRKQFKKVSDAIVTSIEKSDSLKDGYEIAEVKTGDTEIKADVFIGMDSINEN